MDCIRPGDLKNLETIIAAARNGDLGVVSTIERSTAQPAYLLAAFYRDEEGEINIVPMARMFDESPYEDYLSPYEDYILPRGVIDDTQPD